MAHTRWRRAIAALRPRGHVQTGDAAFDGRFVTRGSTEATALLTPEVRHGLLALAEAHPIFLECTRGAVEVRWYANPTAATLTQALDIAASMRSASAPPSRVPVGRNLRVPPPPRSPHPGRP